MHPEKARWAIYSKAGGVCTSRNEEHSKKASCPIRRSLLERLSCSKCEQCAKVDPKIAVRSVRERSTRCSRLHYHASCHRAIRLWAHERKEPLQIQSDPGPNLVLKTCSSSVFVYDQLQSFMRSLTSRERLQVSSGR